MRSKSVLYPDLSFENYRKTIKNVTQVSNIGYKKSIFIPTILDHKPLKPRGYFRFWVSNIIYSIFFSSFTFHEVYLSIILNIKQNIGYLYPMLLSPFGTLSCVFNGLQRKSWV